MTILFSARELFYIFSFLAGLLASVGDSFLNHWAKGASNSLDNLVAGVIFWNISLVFFTLMLKRGLFAESVVYFVVANFLISIVISQVFFHEQLSPLKGFGVVLALCALVAIDLG